MDLEEFNQILKGRSEEVDFNNIVVVSESTLLVGVRRFLYQVTGIYVCRLHQFKEDITRLYYNETNKEILVNTISEAHVIGRYDFRTFPGTVSCTLFNVYGHKVTNLGAECPKEVDVHNRDIRYAFSEQLYELRDEKPAWSPDRLHFYRFPQLSGCHSCALTENSIYFVTDGKISHFDANDLDAPPALTDAMARCVSHNGSESIKYLDNDAICLLTKEEAVKTEFLFVGNSIRLSGGGEKNESEQGKVTVTEPEIISKLGEIEKLDMAALWDGINELTYYMNNEKVQLSGGGYIQLNKVVEETAKLDRENEGLQEEIDAVLDKFHAATPSDGDISILGEAICDLIGPEPPGGKDSQEDLDISSLSDNHTYVSLGEQLFWLQKQIEAMEDSRGVLFTEEYYSENDNTIDYDAHVQTVMKNLKNSSLLVENDVEESVHGARNMSSLDRNSVHR